MSFEGTSEVPPENGGHNPQYTHEYGQGFSGVEPDEVSPTVSGSSALGHEPSTYVAAEEISAPPEPAFGIRQFEAQRPVFEGRPPVEYAAATGGKLQAGINAVHERYDVFRDVDLVHRPGAVHETDTTELVYDAPEGRVLAEVGANTLQLRFAGADGSTAVTHYRVRCSAAYHGRPLDVMEERVDSPEAGALWSVPESVPLRDITVRRVAAARAAMATLVGRMAKGDPIDYPLASTAEAAYVVDEVLANAVPVQKSFPDVVDVLCREHYEDGHYGPITAQDQEATDKLFEKVVDAYRSGQITPEHIINGDNTTTERTTDPDGAYSTTVRTSMLDKVGSTSHRLSISRAERGAGLPFALALAQRDLELSRQHVAAGGTIIDEIEMGKTETGLLCTYTTWVVGTEDKPAPAKKTYVFPPTLATVKVLRNYLLAGGQR